MMALIARAGGLVASFLRDSRGVILPYVTLLLIVFVGLATLALDGGRYMSQQTQMQAIADGLSLAGARELDQKTGARSRATAAINNLVSNGLTGLGYSGAINHAAPVFYSALPVASAGFTGTAATSDFDAKFVAVTVNPVTIPTVFPIRWVRGGVGTNDFSTGAQAIAGFTARAVCDMPPVFICNPYETSGMSDAAATQALRTAMDAPATKRRMIRMDMTQTSPGHFGWLVPPDGCNGASCMRDWIAKTKPKTCYGTDQVDLNTGLKTSVYDALNVRFDMYGGNLKYSADYAPAINVRRGYLPKNGNWCNADIPPKNATPAYPYYTTQPTSTYPIVVTTGNTSNGNAAARKTISAVPDADITKMNAPAGGAAGRMISDPGNVKIPLGANATAATAPNITMDTSSNNPAATGVSLTVKWRTSGLPLDRNWTGICSGGTCLQGDGDWDCLNYWNLNHATAAAPAGCTSSSPTISRYEVYRYEITNNLVGDWSGNGNPNTGGSTTGNGESGAPYCAGTGNGVDPSLDSKQTDRRIIYAAIINCMAQSSLITGGQTADNIPAADFGKFFMTQPAQADGTDYIYGEMTGLVSALSGDKNIILNQVQLYR